MKSKTFTAPTILNSISHCKDGGLRLGFITNELTPKEKFTVISFLQKFGWLLFNENEVQEDEIPNIQAEDKNKTPSKRLRAVIFVWWKQLNSNEDFEIFYRNRVEKLITMIKSKLD